VKLNVQKLTAEIRVPGDEKTGFRIVAEVSGFSSLDEALDYGQGLLDGLAGRSPLPPILVRLEGLEAHP
jgi:hypothetical protein